MKFVQTSPIILEVGVASQIDCVIEKGYPKPEIKWTKKGKNEEVLSNGLFLPFDNPTEENQAVYCVEVCWIFRVGFSAFRFFDHQIFCR